MSDEHRGQVLHAFFVLKVRLEPWFCFQNYERNIKEKKSRLGSLGCVSQCSCSPVEGSQAHLHLMTSYTFIFFKSMSSTQKIYRFCAFCSSLLLYLCETWGMECWDLALWIISVGSSSSLEQVCYEMVECVHKIPFCQPCFPKVFQESLSWLHVRGKLYSVSYLSLKLVFKKLCLYK